ncbi:pyocin knob domain-containing S74 family peptidase [Aeromonas salmonicida]|uniref:pyocin knob domain-containing S74 family peptidase n=1 Tax=Aeromonas salmonicida TaxID=645 RepID=UPI0038BA1076
MATDALKINNTTKRVETLNGFQLHDGNSRVYSDDNKPTPGTLGAVSKSGDTLTGNLNGPEFIQTTPQSTNGAASARKDYVDAKFKAVTIPTGTAPILVNSSVISIVPSSPSTAGSMSAADKSKLDGISGYAVDGKAIKLTGPINFDSLELTGFYTIYNSTAVGSVNPPPFVYGTLIVVGAAKTAGTFVTQIATSKDSGVSFIRSRTDNTMTWTTWNKQYSEKSKPTLDELSAAPAGFGLGEKSGFSLSGKSCNDAVESGFYSVFDGTKDTPYTSTGPSGSSLLVQRWGTGVCTQTFISYVADRIHIRRQYKDVWQPWVEVLTEVNGVAVSGAVMTGALEMKVPGALGQGNYSIKLNNGAIGGINQLVFGDPTEFPSEGIYFPKEGKNDQSAVTEDYDIVRAYNGVLMFNNKPAYGEWNKPSADDLGVFKLELAELTVDLNTLGSSATSAGFYRQTGNVRATPENNYPVAIAGTLLVTPSAYGCQQEYTTFTGRKFQRGLTSSWNGTNGPWGAWTEFYSEVSPIKFVNKAGDTLSGSLNAPDFIQTTAQSNNAAASTRKDYVDAQIKAIDDKNVSKAGDTMTGPLISTQFKASTDYGFVRSTDLVQGMFVGADKRTIIGGGTGSGYVVIRPFGISAESNEVVFNANGITAKDFIQNSAQSTNAAASTRKDYVDAQVKGVEDRNVNKAGDTMTGMLNFAQIKSAANFWNKSSIKFADGVNSHFHLFSEANSFKISAGTDGQTNMMSIDSAGNMDVAGSTVSKYFRTDELGGTDTVAPYRSASSGGAFAAMYNRHASFHTDVVQAGSSYAPNTSIKYQHNAGWAGMYSTGVLNNSAASPGAYCIAHVSSNAADAFTWSFDGKSGRFASSSISTTSIDVSGQMESGGIKTTGGITINHSSPTILMQDTDGLSAFIHTNGNTFHVLRSAAANGTGYDGGPNGVHPMTLNLSTGDVTFSRNGSFNNVQIRSDRRLKSNFKVIESALDRVDTLTGMTFDKVGCEAREAGLIAQDVQAVLPEAVGSFSTTAGDEYLTLSSSGINALLVEAIKELRAEFNQFKSQSHN